MLQIAVQLRSFGVRHKLWIEKLKVVRESDRCRLKASVAATHLQRDGASPAHWIENDIRRLRFTQPIEARVSM